MVINCMVVNHTGDSMVYTKNRVQPVYKYFTEAGLEVFRRGSCGKQKEIILRVMGGMGAGYHSINKIIKHHWGEITENRFGSVQDSLISLLNDGLIKHEPLTKVKGVWYMDEWAYMLTLDGHAAITSPKGYRGWRSDNRFVRDRRGYATKDIIKVKQ